MTFLTRRWLATFAACVLGLALSSGFAVAADAPARLEIKPGDHIAIIGNTLADRMQHDGWLEDVPLSAVPQARAGHPQPRLLRRRADGPAPLGRLRHARRVADRRPRPTSSSPSSATTSRSPARTGSTKFKKDLDAFIKHTLGQKYNGKTAPRLVLFSPIAHEDLHDRNLPDGAENNERLELYTAAMAEVAKAERRPVRRPVPPDAGRSTRRPPKPLTINGVHLTDERQPHARRRIIDQALFAGSRPASATPTASRSSARPSSTRTSTGSTATARSTATRSTAAGPTCSSSAARPTAWSRSARWKSST